MMTYVVVLPDDEFEKWYNTPNPVTTTTTDSTGTKTDSTKIQEPVNTDSGKVQSNRDTTKTDTIK
jgi:hypothetical protein